MKTTAISPLAMHKCSKAIAAAGQAIAIFTAHNDKIT